MIWQKERPAAYTAGLHPAPDKSTERELITWVV